MSIIRDVTLEAEKQLVGDEVLLFIGPRQAGKTTILKQLENSLQKRQKPVYFLNLEDPDYLTLLNKSPKNLFKIFTLDLGKKNFVIIDEVQYLDNPSNFLKYFYDEYGGRIKILASGSSAFYLDKKFKDSLAGRKKIFNVKTLSFREFLRFKGEELLAKRNFRDLSLSDCDKATRHYHEFVVYGGYPRVVLAPLSEREEILRDIAYSYIKKDIFEANIRQDEVFYRLLKLLAVQVGNLVNASELANTLGVSKTSIDNYLYVMRKSFHINLVRPFFRNARKEITKMPKIYFGDLGLRNFLVSNFSSFEMRSDKGQLLENATFRQLLESFGEDSIKFWRTNQGQEIDFVAKGKQAFEVKVDPGQFKASKYKAFIEEYPEISVTVVSLNTEEKSVSGYEVVNAWEV